MKIKSYKSKFVDWLNKIIIYVISILIKYRRENVIKNTRFVSGKRKNKNKKNRKLTSIFRQQRIQRKRKAIRLYKNILQKWIDRVISFLLVWILKLVSPQLRRKINKIFNLKKLNQKNSKVRQRQNANNRNKFKNWSYLHKNKCKKNKFALKRKKRKGRCQRIKNKKRFINLKIPRLSFKNRKILREIYNEYIFPLKNKDLNKINRTVNVYQKTLNWLDANKCHLSITYDFIYLLVQTAYLCAEQLQRYQKLQKNYDNLLQKYENLKSRLNLRVQGGGSITASKTIVLKYTDPYLT